MTYRTRINHTLKQRAEMWAREHNINGFCIAYAKFNVSGGHSLSISFKYISLQVISI